MFIRARNEKHTTRSMECSRKKTRKINYVWISVRTRYLESQPSLSLSLFKDQKYRARWRAMESAKRATLAKAVSYQFSSPFYFSLSVFLSLSLPLSHFKRSDCFHLAWSGQWRAVLADYSAILFFRCHGGPGGGRIVFVRCLFPFFQISFSLFLSTSSPWKTAVALVPCRAWWPKKMLLFFTLAVDGLDEKKQTKVASKREREREKERWNRLFCSSKKKVPNLLHWASFKSIPFFPFCVDLSLGGSKVDEDIW